MHYCCHHFFLCRGESKIKIMSRNLSAPPRFHVWGIKIGSLWAYIISVLSPRGVIIDNVPVYTTISRRKYRENCPES